MASVNLPSEVLILCDTCDAWIVGSSADPENSERLSQLNDIDIIVPFDKWDAAKLVIPDHAELNSFKGIKFVTSRGWKVDLWPCEIGRFIIDSRSNTKYLWNPVKDIRVEAVRN